MFVFLNKACIMYLQQWFLTLFGVLNLANSINASIESIVVRKKNVCREFYLFYFYFLKSLIAEPLKLTH